MLPMQHGKQNHNKTSVFTLEGSSCDFGWRPLYCKNASFILILLPMLHGKHIFALCRKSLFSLLRAWRLTWPHIALKVHFSFCCKIALKRWFSLVGKRLFFYASSLGLSFSKGYFRTSFFAFFKFCYTSPSKRTVFRMRSCTFLTHFENMRFTADV